MTASSNRIDPCPACGSDYEIKYYQRRAADEPPDSVIYCPNCPLDTGKLSLQFDPNINDISTRSNDRAIKNTMELHRKNRSSTPTSILERIDARYIIKVDGSAASRCYKSISAMKYRFSSIVEIAIPIQTGQNREIARFHLQSSTANEAHIVTSSEKIAPYVLLQKVDILVQKESTFDYGVRVISGYEHILDSIPGSSLTTLRTLYGGKQPSILVYLEGSYLNSSINENVALSVLQYVLTTYGTENSIRSFISSSIVSSLYIQSGKAYDWPSAPLQGYSFTWKPDGERFWYVRYGSVWLFSRRLLSGRIAGWNLAGSLKDASKIGPILDIEVMIGHDPILIDILVLESGLPTIPLRSVDYVLAQYKLMRSIDVPIFIRSYFRSEKEVLETANMITYPTDGIVGIEDNSMDIIKLKGTKSIELKLLDNGNLISGDNKIVMTSTLHDTYTPGSIVEIRFTRRSYQDIPSITESLLRTDKLKANSYEACQNIINTISDMPDTLARRKAVIWCSTIRQKLHRIGANTKGRGRIIIDIGSGDGQAISDYSTDPDITYLLIEPSLSKCKKLVKRIGESGRTRCRLYETTDNILKVLSSLSNGSLKYAIVNSTLEDLVSQDQCLKVLKSCVRYCIASFSISYTLTTLSTLALSGIDIIGCGYMYDSANSDGTLIDEYGVKMKITDNNNIATVVWGSDKEYQEPAITTTSFKDVFNIQLATNLVPVFKDSTRSLLDIVSSKVYVISTKRHV
jgi:hypothetical protein